MDAAQNPRYGVDAYLDWVEREGLPVTEDFGVDLYAVPTRPWPRYGVKGAAVHLKGRGDFANMFVLDIPPGGSTSPQRHLYEDVYYVLEGSGSTQLEFADGKKRSFEWGPRSLFAIPLNAKHRHFNASGRERALLVTTTDLPLVMNMFHNERFIFDTDFEFDDRIGKNEYFAGEGDLITVRPGNNIWETNFVPDLASIELKSWGDRGAGGTNIMFVLADGTMHAHISEMPVGTYKKAHRHGPGFHVMCVTGHGYSLPGTTARRTSPRSTGSTAPCSRPATSSSTSTSTPASSPRATSRPASAACAIRSPCRSGARCSASSRATRARSRSTSRRAATRSSTRTRTCASTASGSTRCGKTASSRRWRSISRAPSACL